MPNPERRLLFIDNRLENIRALQKQFGPDVRGVVGNIVDSKTISDWPISYIIPGNSFGIMDGGVDKALSTRWPGVETAVRTKIRTDWPSGLPVGAAVVVPLISRSPSNTRRDFLIYAPTMPIPMDIQGTPNVFLAMAAALRMAPSFTQLICPALGTNTGGVPPETAAYQMHLAWIGTPLPHNWDEVRRICYPPEALLFQG